MKADEGRGMEHVRWGEVGEARWGKTFRVEVLLDSERLQHHRIQLVLEHRQHLWHRRGSSRARLDDLSLCHRVRNMA